jgi:tetratricopeptide (TPR) repeat protein
MKKCPECGTNLPYRDNYCYSCDRTFEDTEPEGPDHPRLDLSKEEWRKPWAAAGLSAVGIGLGQFYNGESLKGLLFLIIVIATPFVLPLYITFNPLFVMAIVWAAAVADAWLSARKINQLQKKFTKKSVLFWPEVVVLILVAGFILLMAYVPHVASHSLVATAGAVADTKYPASAVPLYDSAVILYPHDTEIRMSRAKFMHTIGRNDEAQSDLRYLMVTDPNATAPLVMTGNLLYDNGEYDASLRYFEKALNLNRNDAQIWIRKGDASLAIAITDMQKMRRQYRTLTSGDTASAANYSAEDRDAFRSTQAYRDAMAAYNQAIKIDPLMSVEVSAHVLAATRSLVEMYDGILDDIGSPDATMV